MVVTKDSTIKSLIIEFASNTNMHGIGSMFRAHSAPLRVFVWTVIVAVAWTLFGLTVNKVIQKYLERNVTVSIDIKTDPMIAFPAVTICNLNPVRISGIHTIVNKYNGTDKYKQVQELCRIKEELKEMFDLQYPPGFGPNGPGGPGGPGGGEPPPPSPPPPGHHRHKREFPDYQAVYDYEEDPDLMASLTEQMNSTGTNSTSNMAYWNMIEQNSGKDGLSNSEDAATLHYIEFLQTMTKLAPSIKRKLGHQLLAMLISCRFGNNLCTPKSFSYFWNYRYGNCYTFNAGWNASVPVFKATAPGPSHGLTLELFVEENEYVREITNNIGLKIVVHDQGRMPFPDDEGMQLTPGLDTSLGIRMKEVRRLPFPYPSDCIEGLGYPELNAYDHANRRVSYSKQACLRTCLQNFTLHKCGCGTHEIPIRTKAFESVPAVQNATKNQWLVCDTINNQTQRKRSTFSDKLYTTSYTLSRWPNTDYMKILKEQLKKRSSYWENLFDGKGNGAVPLFPQEQRQQSRHKRQISGEQPPAPGGGQPPPPGSRGPPPAPMGDSDVMSTMERNLVKLQVYYEDLNYELIAQVEAYDTTSMISDIGGNMGMFIGLSIVALFEVFELIFDLFWYFASSERYRRKRLTVAERSKQQPEQEAEKTVD